MATPETDDSMRDYGWGLYFAAGAVIQLVAAFAIAREFAYGWIAAIGMLWIAVLLARAAARDLRIGRGKQRVS